MKGQLLKRVLNFSRGVSIVSNTFEQNINLGYDLVFVLITGPKDLGRLSVHSGNLHLEWCAIFSLQPVEPVYLLYRKHPRSRALKSMYVSVRIPYLQTALNQHKLPQRIMFRRNKINDSFPVQYVIHCLKLVLFTRLGCWRCTV